MTADIVGREAVGTVARKAVVIAGLKLEGSTAAAQPHIVTWASMNSEPDIAAVIHVLAVAPVEYLQPV